LNFTNVESGVSASGPELGRFRSACNNPIDPHALGICHFISSILDRSISDRRWRRTHRLLDPPDPVTIPYALPILLFLLPSVMELPFGREEEKDGFNGLRDE